MILKKVYISRGGVKANLEKVYILIFFFFMTASLRELTNKNTTVFSIGPLISSNIVGAISIFLKQGAV